MASLVRARNELVRVSVQLDPPNTIGRPRRMSTVETIQLIMYMCRAGCPWSPLVQSETPRLHWSSEFLSF